MKQTLHNALNDQIQEELYSGYLYWAMAAHCANQNLLGFENWFMVQAQEERDHALGFYNYLVARGAQVTLKALKQPPATFKGPLHLFEEALKHEQHITAKINALYELAGKEKDFATQSFLKWYLDEQVEEEANAQAMIDAITLVGNKGEALYLLDKELAARTYKQAAILMSKE